MRLKSLRLRLILEAAGHLADEKENTCVLAFVCKVARGFPALAVSEAFSTASLAAHAGAPCSFRVDSHAGSDRGGGAGTISHEAVEDQKSEPLMHE
jgi:hypothetical protein